MAAPADTETEELEGIREPCNIDAVIDFKSEEAGKARQRGPARVVGIDRVMHLRDARMLAQAAGDHQPTVHMAANAERQCAQAPRQQEGFERRQLGAEEGVRQLVNPGDHRGGARDGTCHRVAMAADIFRRRMNHQIDAMQYRLLENRGGPGIVDHGHDAQGLCRLAQPRNVLQLEHHRAGAFKVEQPGARQCRLDGIGIAAIDILDRDAKARQKAFQRSERRHHRHGAPPRCVHPTARPTTPWR